MRERAIPDVSRHSIICYPYSMKQNNSIKHTYVHIDFINYISFMYTPLAIIVAECNLKKFLFTQKLTKSKYL